MSNTLLLSLYLAVYVCGGYKDTIQSKHTTHITVHTGSYSPNMAIEQTDWSVFLNSQSDLPTDIVFNVIEQEVDPEKDELNQNEPKTAQIPAHKFLLAGVSPVFRA